MRPILVFVVVALHETAYGFLLSNPSMSHRASISTDACSSSVRMSASDQGRRDFMKQASALALGTLFFVGPKTNAFEYDAKEGDAAREKYLEEVRSSKAAKWTRQVCIYLFFSKRL